MEKPKRVIHFDGATSRDLESELEVSAEPVVHEFDEAGTEELSQKYNVVSMTRNDVCTSHTKNGLPVCKHVEIYNSGGYTGEQPADFSKITVSVFNVPGLSHNGCIQFSFDKTWDAVRFFEAVRLVKDIQLNSESI